MLNTPSTGADADIFLTVAQKEKGAWGHSPQHFFIDHALWNAGKRPLERRKTPFPIFELENALSFSNTINSYKRPDNRK